MIAAGDRLRDLREDKGKTQAEISSLLGTTQQIYSRYETNRTDLPLRHLIKLADYYQVSADYILGRTSYPKNPPEMAKPFLKNVTYGEVNGRISSFQTSTKKQLIEYINYLVYLESRQNWLLTHENCPRFLFLIHNPARFHSKQNCLFPFILN